VTRRRPNPERPIFASLAMRRTTRKPYMKRRATAARTPQCLRLTPSASAPSDNPSINRNDRDDPCSHERGYLCGFCEGAAVERHAYRPSKVLHGYISRLPARSLAGSVPSRNVPP
jgi:hypothetical protein